MDPDAAGQQRKAAKAALFADIQSAVAAAEKGNKAEKPPERTQTNIDLRCSDSRYTDTEDDDGPPSWLTDR